MSAVYTYENFVTFNVSSGMVSIYTCTGNHHVEELSCIDDGDCRLCTNNIKYLCEKKRRRKAILVECIGFLLFFLAMSQVEQVRLGEEDLT